MGTERCSGCGFGARTLVKEIPIKTHQQLRHLRCDHRGAEVKVGDYAISLGGTNYFQPGDVDDYDVLIPLTETGLAFGKMVEVIGGQKLKEMPPLTAWRRYKLLPLPIVDFQAPPDNWGDILSEKVVPWLAMEKRVLAFCIGSHGRAGTLGASLIALLEPQSADPVADIRARHCIHAVETREQAAAVEKLKR